MSFSHGIPLIILVLVIFTRVQWTVYGKIVAILASVALSGLVYVLVRIMMSPPIHVL